MRLGKKKEKKEKSKTPSKGKEKEETKSKAELKPQDSKGDVKKDSSKPAEVQSPTSPKAADTSASGAKSSTKTLLSSYATWDREKWTLSASEITKGLRSWNFKMEAMKVRSPTTNNKRYIFEDCWVILHLEFILIWKNHVDKQMPPIATIPPDDFVALGICNPKLIEPVTARTQKDSLMGDRLLKFENTFRVGSAEYMFECNSEDDMKTWMGLVNDTVIALLKSRKYFDKIDPDETWLQIQTEIPPAWSGVLRDPFKDGEEEEWLVKVVKIKEGYQKHNEAMRRLKVWSRYFNDTTQYYMEWLAAANNAEYGVGRELVTAQDKTCEKWKQKFHDFKPVEKHFPELNTMSHTRRDKIILYCEKMTKLCDLYSKYFEMLNKRESPYGPVRKKWVAIRDRTQQIKEALIAEEERLKKEEEKERRREVKRQKKLAVEALLEQAKQNSDPFSFVNVYRTEDPFNDVWVDDVVNMYGEIDNPW